MNGKSYRKVAALRLAGLMAKVIIMLRPLRLAIPGYFL
jgi:hypothetical protein